MSSRIVQAALVVAGLFLVLLLTLVIFGLPLGPSVQLIASGAFGDKFGLSRTIVKATPLLLCGLGAVVAWRAGMYNIGGEGQFLVGAMSGAGVARAFAETLPSAPGILVLPLILFACTLGGGVFAAIAGWLYVKRGVEVVISTILLNFVALQLLDWAVQGPLQEIKRQVPLSEPLNQAWLLPRADRQMDLNAGTLLALVAAVSLYLFLYRSADGYRLRLVGENPSAARANRISAPRSQMQAMLISGALCGLAGGVEYTGIVGQIGTSSAQGWGFVGIPVALVGALHPMGTVLSAVYFGALFAGSENLARFTPAGQTLVYVIQGLAVLALVGLRAWTGRRSAVTEEE